MTDAKKIVIIIGYVAVTVYVMLMFTGCGSIIRDATQTVKVEGDATITHRVEMDMSICDDLQGQDKIDCIKAVVSIATILTQTQGARTDE